MLEETLPMHGEEEEVDFDGGGFDLLDGDDNEPHYFTTQHRGSCTVREGNAR